MQNLLFNLGLASSESDTQACGIWAVLFYGALPFSSTQHICNMKPKVLFLPLWYHEYVSNLSFVKTLKH